MRGVKGRACLASRIESAAAQTTPPAPVSVADELAKLATLRDSGVLNDAEFRAQKAKLLG